jgi:pimeloyl-ACP methyl ester carboxylesterase
MKPMTPTRSIAVGLVLSIAATFASAQGPALDHTPSRFAPYQGIRLHYKSLGLGTTAVVFIHGWNGDLTLWRGQVPAVDGRVRSIFLDLPGFGRSDKPDAVYSMEYFAGAVDAVIQAAGVQRVVLVGHSMGTPIIRQYYRKYPAKVIALVAVDGPLRPFFTDTLQVRQFLAGFEGADYGTNLERMFDGIIGPTADSALRATIKHVALATPQRVAASALREMMNPAIWRDDPILVPVLAVMAPNPNWTPEYVTYVKSLAPGIRYETVSGVGHFLMMERPEVFNALLVDFLRSQRVVR